MKSVALFMMTAGVAISIAAFMEMTSAVQAAESSDDVRLSARQQEGKTLFEATCNYCHNPRGWATDALRARVSDARAVLAERNDLDRDYIRAVVRKGLVNMPAYTPTDLNESQLQAVADYLTRKNSQSKAAE